MISSRIQQLFSSLLYAFFIDFAEEIDEDQEEQLDDYYTAMNGLTSEKEMREDEIKYYYSKWEEAIAEHGEGSSEADEIWYIDVKGLDNRISDLDFYINLYKNAYEDEFSEGKKINVLTLFCILCTYRTDRLIP